MLLYPLYAVLFAESGLSAAQISSLFILWSVTSFALEIPSGVLADAVSRRALVVLAPLFAAAGFALWTFAPGYPAFAVGFVLWGVGGALQSGALQALVYEELARVGRQADYARLIGRSEALRSTAVVAASALAAPVAAWGGHRAVGVCSIAATMLAAAVAATLPEHRSSGGRESTQPDTDVAVVAATSPASPTLDHALDYALDHALDHGASDHGVPDHGAPDGAERGAGLRGALREVGATPGLRGLLLLSVVVTGCTAVDEYVPLLARATVPDAAAVPLLVALVTVGDVVGGLLAGRGTRWAAPAMVVAACCLAGGALSGHPAGLVPVAVAFGVFRWAMAAADAAVQHRAADRHRSTITSIAGFGSEVLAVLTFAGYAVGSGWLGPGALFAVMAVPYLLVAVPLRRVHR